MTQTLEEFHELANRIRQTRPDLVAPTVLSKSSSRRYSLHVVYAANQIDFHKDWSSPDAIFDASIDYVRKTAASGRTIYLEHDDSQIMGEWVHCFVTPADMTTDLSLPGEPSRRVTLRKGSALLGCIWTPEAWSKLQAGEIRGLSFGGRGKRVRAKLASKEPV